MKSTTTLVAGVVVLGIIGLGALRACVFQPTDDTVTVVHWTTGHLLQEEAEDLHLLDDMADDFNGGNHRTADGKRIEVKVYYASGGTQAPELISRVTKGVPGKSSSLPDPTLVTPSASHWLVNVNAAAGREVFDLSDTESRSIARSYVGIVTYREIAECLGWPNRDIGYSDIIALRADPRGWEGYTCAKGTPRAEWGDRPLLTFTDPKSSDTGRAVLFMLYSMAAGKAPADLTEADLQRPDVVQKVRDFQQLVDHYQPETADVNSKVYQGPRYGHFFLMPEDNLIHLYAGTEEAYIDGVETTAPPLHSLGRDVVMIYPNEGALLRENCACIPDAPWVSPEQREGAEEWITYLREDAQQREFMKGGFRPGTELPVGGAVGPANGLNPATPAKVLHMEQVNPAVATRIDELWQEVKRPGVVVFVVDTSLSMKGAKLEQAQDGLIRCLDAMAQNNSVGMISFSDATIKRSGVVPLREGKFSVAAEVQALKAEGGTALYDAIKAGVSLADSATASPESIRAVVVLTDGKANRGATRLDDIVTMTSTAEQPIVNFDGMELDAVATDARGAAIPKTNIIGMDSRLATTHDVQIFFVGVGDADLEIGRILAEATGAEFRGTTDEDLANVLEVFSGYF